MKKFLFILTSIFIFIPICVNASEVPEVDTSLKIYDYAELYSETEENELRELLNSYIEKYELDMVVLTISDNPYYDLENVSYSSLSLYQEEATIKYTEEFYDLNDFGYGSDDNGIILVIDMETRFFYICTTGSVRNYMDIRIETILTSMDNYMYDADYYGATLKYIKQVRKYILYHRYGPWWLWTIVVLGAILIGYIVVKIETRKYKLINRERKADLYLTEKNINYSVDNMVGENRIFVPNSDSSSGGYSGGGGHHSSGGGHSSHGGGGHHF